MIPYQCEKQNFLSFYIIQKGYAFYFQIEAENLRKTKVKIENNKLEGFGIGYYNNDICCLGQFKNGIMDGYGIQYSEDYYYEGYFEKGHKRGIGIMEFKDENIYEGEFENDKKHGIGKYILENGSKYEGEYKNDIINGFGSFTFKNGSMFEGKFNNDDCYFNDDLQKFLKKKSYGFFIENRHSSNKSRKRVRKIFVPFSHY